MRAPEAGVQRGILDRLAAELVEARRGRRTGNSAKTARAFMPSRESSLRNLEKARENWRRPRALRSYKETCLIRRLVWQWSRSDEPEKSSGRALARWLGISHTWIQKLVREFARDPNKMQRELLVHGQVTIAQLRRARELTREQRERGWLREPRRWRKAELKIGSNTVRAIVPTKASLRPATKFEDIPPDAPSWTVRGLYQNKYYILGFLPSY